jgi:hypothetical protein
MPLERFIVTFETFKGQRTSYSVVVWNGRDKAVSLATYWHTFEHPKDEIFHVFVDELGPPDSNPDGTPVMSDDDMTDRLEW